MATQVNDTFTDTNGVELENHTPDTDVPGGGWSVTGGASDWTIQSNELDLSSSSSGNRRGTIETNTADLTASVDAKILAANSFVSAGLVFRYSDASNYWRADFTTDGNFRLVKVEGGTPATVVSKSILLSIPSSFRTIEVVTSGSSIEATLDGADALNTSDPFNSTATVCGIYSNLATGDQCRFDTFLVTDDALVIADNETPAVIAPAIVASPRVLYYQSFAQPVGFFAEGRLFVDQWHRPSEEAPRVVKPLIAEGTTVIDAGSLQAKPLADYDLSQHNDLPVGRKSSYVAEGAATIDADALAERFIIEWHRQTSEAPHSVSPHVAEGWFTTDDLQEPISTEWFQPASETAREIKPLLAEGLSTIDADQLTLPEFTGATWEPQTSEPPRSIKPLLWEGQFVIDVFALSEPLRFAFLQQQIPPQPPPRRNVPVAEGMTLLDADALTERLLEWYVQAVESPREIVPAVAEGFYAIDPDAWLEVNVSGWWVQPSEAPQFVRPATTEGVTLIDADVLVERFTTEWHPSESILTRDIQRNPEAGYSAVDPSALTDQVRFGWNRQTERPPLPQRRNFNHDGSSLSGTLEPSLYQTPFFSDWYQQSSEAPRRIRPFFAEGAFVFNVHFQLTKSSIEYASLGSELHFKAMGSGQI